MITTDFWFCICDTYRETIPKVGKMKTIFHEICDKGSSLEYLETFPNLLGAKLIEIKQFEIASTKK